MTIPPHSGIHGAARTWLVGILSFTLALLLALHAGGAQAADIVDALPFENHAQEVRFQKLAGQLRCLVCQDESLAASGADLAKKMRGIVFEKMQEGMTDDEIKQYLVDRYSDYVLYKPPVNKTTYVLWFGPAIIFLIGIVIVLLFIRAKHHPQPSVDSDSYDDDDW